MAAGIEEVLKLEKHRGTTLREFLEERERQVKEALGIVERVRAPLELELAEIQKSKAALDGSGKPYPQKFYIRRTVPQARFYGGGIATDVDVLPPVRSRFEAMTIKELIRMALTEHFPQGATARELINFIREVYGRTIERWNFSPQLSRLRQDGEVTLDEHVWKLIDTEAASASETPPHAG
jgi:hypothetical protein